MHSVLSPSLLNRYRKSSGFAVPSRDLALAGAGGRVCTEELTLCVMQSSCVFKTLAILPLLLAHQLGYLGFVLFLGI